MKNKIFYLLPLLLIHFSTFAQDVIGFESDSSVNFDNLELGKELFKKGDYYEAVPYLENASRQRLYKKDFEILYDLGKAARVSRLYKQSEDAYDRLIKKTKDYPDAYFYLAQMQMVSQDYEDAADNYNKFLKQKDIDEDLKSLANDMLDVISKISEYKDDPTKYAVQILPKEVNVNASNYGSFYSHDRLWYTSSVEILDFQKAKVGGTETGYESYYIDRLFNSEITETGFNKGLALENLMYSRSSNYLPPVFSEDGKVIFTSICKKGGKKQCWIYWADYEQGGAIDLDWVADPVNDFSHSSKDPCVVNIGDKQVVFFSSKRKGVSEGEYDLYYVEFDTATGEPGELIDLGKEINTPFDEISPFYDKKTKTLFFSSNGHKGIGQFDIYSVTGSPAEGWGSVKNLGEPINSQYDDYYYYQITTKDSISGYLSSNRIEKETCCDKIYEFSKQTRYYNLSLDLRGCYDYIVPKGFEIYVNPLTFEKEKVSNDTDSTNEYTMKLIQDRPIIVTIIHPDYDTMEIEVNSEKDTLLKINLHPAFIELTGTIKGESYNKILRDGRLVFIDRDGRNEIIKTEANQEPFEVRLKNYYAYEVEVTGKYHMMKNFDLNFEDSEICSEKATRNFKLITVDIGASILKNKIEFKTASYDIKESSFPELDRLVEFILDNPDIILEVQGHTDNIGAYLYNMNLSQKRSESIVRYLIEHGVPSKQLIAKGYGFSKPIATNRTEEGRAKNRRVGFKVIYVDENKRELLNYDK